MPFPRGEPASLCYLGKWHLELIKTIKTGVPSFGAPVLL